MCSALKKQTFISLRNCFFTMKNINQILEMTPQFWPILFCLIKCLVLFILGTNLIILCLLLAGLAHFTSGNQQVILKDVRDRALKFLVGFVIGISCLLDGDFNKAFKEQSVLEKSHPVPDIIFESAPLRVTSGKSKRCLFKNYSLQNNKDSSCSETNEVSQSRVTQTDALFLSEQSFKVSKNDGESASILKDSMSFKEKPLKLAPFCQANESHF